MAEALPQLPEELEFELEALRATYGEDAVTVEAAPTDGSPAAAARVSLPVAPRCAAEHERFVCGRLLLAVPAGYPEEAPEVQLTDAKGGRGTAGRGTAGRGVGRPLASCVHDVSTLLAAACCCCGLAQLLPRHPSAPLRPAAAPAGLGDARLAGVQAALAVEAAQLAGELQLGHLCETALDLLTAGNQPEGACAFCLEPLLAADGPSGASGGGGSGGSGTRALLRLGCYHAYHAACFAPWWHWQQARLAGRERQLWEEYRGMAPLKLREEGIRREDGSGATGSSGSGGGDSGGAANGAAEGAADADGSGASDEAAKVAAAAAGDTGAFVLACPSCRADVPPSSLEHAWQQLQVSRLGGASLDPPAA